MFEMKDEYKLGIPHIDEQHTKLFDLGEKAYQMLFDIECHNKYEKIVDMVYKLRDYASVHFRDEEAYMESIGYIGLECQKKEHAIFEETFQKMDLLKIKENEDDYLIEILDFVSRWLVSHIIEKDKLIEMHTKAIE